MWGVYSFPETFSVEGNTLVQPSRMVLELGRLRRPERFFAVFAHGAFPRKCTMRKHCKRDAGRGRASACTGLLPPRFVMSSRKETRVRYEVGRRDGVAG